MRPSGRLGGYELIRRLGVGGMAELYLARIDGIGGFSKLVALKRIFPRLAMNQRLVRMFLDEARLVATLSHPNIAQVHDVGCEDGDYFFAQEYIEGADLRAIMDRAVGGRLALRHALHIAIGVCAGLHHAHEARGADGRPLGVVHRDVSPSNVLVSRDGAVKLVDFGVAKATSDEARDSIMGKSGYMSPEQCVGAPVDRRTDVFAVGILLWEMTVGRRLYDSAGEVAVQHQTVCVDAPRPATVCKGYPLALDAIVTRALARDADQRYQTARELQLALERFALAAGLALSPIATGAEVRRMLRAAQLDPADQVELELLEPEDELADLATSVFAAVPGLIHDSVGTAPMRKPRSLAVGTGPPIRRLPDPLPPAWRRVRATRVVEPIAPARGLAPLAVLAVLSLLLVAGLWVLFFAG